MSSTFSLFVLEGREVVVSKRWWKRRKIRSSMEAVFVYEQVER
jgi:hypothetical protein